MLFAEKKILLGLWEDWAPGKPLVNGTYADFFFEVVREHPRLKQANVYDVLDLLVNEGTAPAEYPRKGPLEASALSGRETLKRTG